MFVNAMLKSLSGGERSLFSELDGLYTAYVPISKTELRPPTCRPQDCLLIPSNSLIFVKAQHMFSISIVHLIGWNSIIANRLKSSLKSEL